jgi:hypothetical protein
MSGAPFKKLPASPSVSGSSVPVADRGGEEVNVGFSDFGAGSGNQLRDPRAGRRAVPLKVACQEDVYLGKWQRWYKNQVRCRIMTPFAS